MSSLERTDWRSRAKAAGTLNEFSERSQCSRNRLAVLIMRAAGMHASVSSIHINGWFGEHDKLSGARWIVREQLGRTLDAEIDRWAFVGDSMNDQVMFRAFANSTGVANIARFEAELTDRPRYRTPAKHGAGFAQVADAILTARMACTQ